MPYGPSLRVFVTVCLLFSLAVHTLAQSTCPEETSEPHDVTYTNADLQAWTAAGDGKIGSNIIAGSDGSIQFLLDPDAQRPELVSPNSFLFKDLTASVTFRIERDEDAEVKFGWLPVGKPSLNPAFGLYLGSQTSAEPPEGATMRSVTAITNDFGKGNPHVALSDYKDVQFGDSIKKQPTSDYALSGNFVEGQGFIVGDEGHGTVDYTLTAVLGEEGVVVSGHSDKQEDGNLMSYGFTTAHPDLQFFIGATSNSPDAVGPYLSVLSLRINGCRVLTPEQIEAKKVEAVAALRGQTDALEEQNKADPPEEAADAATSTSDPTTSQSPTSSQSPSPSVQVNIPTSQPTPVVSVFTSTGTTSMPKTVDRRVKTITATTLVPITDDSGQVYSVKPGQQQGSASSKSADLGSFLGLVMFPVILCML